MNKHSPEFFGSLHDILLHDIVLSIGRLTDPASSGKEKDNASLKMLLKRTKNEIGKKAESDLKDALKELSAKSQKIRDLRNKLIAHSDLNIKLGKNEPLPGVSRSEIEDILQLIREIFNLLEGYFVSGKTVFNDYMVMNDAEFLISILEDKSQ